MTHDYIRPVSSADIPPGDRAEPDGTTTLFAALNVLDGSVIGQCMQRHRHQEFIRFLNQIERDVPAGKLIHVVLDNYATHKHQCGRLTVVNWVSQQIARCRNRAETMRNLWRTDEQPQDATAELHSICALA